MDVRIFLFAVGIICILTAAFLTVRQLVQRKKRKKTSDLVFALAFCAVLCAAGAGLLFPQIAVWREAAQPLYSETVRYAAMTKDTDAVRKLLSEGRSANESYDTDGWTPLICACQSFSDNDDPQAALAIVNLLLDAGADPDRTDRYGYSPLLFAAGENGYSEIVARLLQERVAVDRRVGETTALKQACLCGDTESARLLLAAGARMDGDTYNPLPDAVYPGRFAKYEMVKLLLDAGADTATQVVFYEDDGSSYSVTLREALRLDYESYIDAGCPAYDFGAGVSDYEDNYDRIFALLP